MPTSEFEVIKGIDNPRLAEMFPREIEQLKMEVELVHGASHPFDLERFLAGAQTPVFFGSAINNFGVREILNALVDWAPAPRERDATVRAVEPAEPRFPASSSRSRPTWTRRTATASPSCASARAASSAA